MTADAVARALFADDCVVHAEWVIVGQALSRLARNGKARRIERKGHESCGWALAEREA